jgi:hypothetical protein
MFYPGPCFQGQFPVDGYSVGFQRFSPCARMHDIARSCTPSGPKLAQVAKLPGDGMNRAPK